MERRLTPRHLIHKGFKIVEVLFFDAESDDAESTVCGNLAHDLSVQPFHNRIQLEHRMIEHLGFGIHLQTAWHCPECSGLSVRLNCWTDFDCLAGLQTFTCRITIGTSQRPNTEFNTTKVPRP